MNAKRVVSKYPYVTISVKLTRKENAEFEAYLKALDTGAKKGPHTKALIMRAVRDHESIQEKAGAA
jgi:hypothetical protein